MTVTMMVVFHVQLNAVPSEEVPLAILYHKLSAARDEQSQLKLRRQIDELLEVGLATSELCTLGYVIC